MNLGLLSGYFGSENLNIISTQNIVVNGASNIASVSCFVAPPEATLALISGIGFQYDRFYSQPPNASYYEESGPGACYRVPFKLSPTLRYIPVVCDSVSYIYIGSDGFDNYDLNSTYGPRYESMPCIRLFRGYQNSAGGDAWYYERASNTNTVTITAAGGLSGNPGAKGGDGKVVMLPNGGIIAGGGGSGGGTDDYDASAVGYNGGNVPAPWGTMLGGITDVSWGAPGGGGASLYSHGRSYSYSTGKWNLPGNTTESTTGTQREAAWVYCEFISEQVPQ